VPDLCGSKSTLKRTHVSAFGSQPQDAWQ
jgi:hypothetical protein